MVVSLWACAYVSLVACEGRCQGAQERHSQYFRMLFLFKFCSAMTHKGISSFLGGF